MINGRIFLFIIRTKLFHFHSPPFFSKTQGRNQCQGEISASLLDLLNVRLKGRINRLMKK